ncbi:RNA polymerase sigma factor [Tenacibaculum agarivorans]|uniref:RNA polymerase sigma factor n=1 Tax=Tenacibaculum agarivorans TaxID=1908389 RepID=UPI00094BC49F|nr:RNA polymerase sigma-70 factor [Tenacibaculum agarivorans]
MNPIKNSVCEKAVFETIFREHSKTIRNFIYMKCGNLSQAEDLTQDAFIKLWKNCAKVPVQKVKSYLFTITKNAFFNEYEHQKVVLKYRDIQRDKVNIEDPEFQLQQKEFQQKLDNAINRLKPKEREVFLLNRIEKKKYREIAELLGIAVKTVEMRMHSALVTMRKEIKNYKI